MATGEDFVLFVIDQVQGPWELRYRKMFGEYLVYVNDKPILLICDNTVFVKMLPQVAQLLPDAETGFPYEGAKEHYVLPIDDSEIAQAVVGALEPITDVPKPRKKAAKK
ncbi:MAG: hypothetical protein LBU38_01005 [Propionibacteriaceae bacterium]|jgi:TfoX/Sxy family transcriptional regulator of competence genes|nr:hypothetical protein [Propionibacteriaceae bacterium]